MDSFPLFFFFLWNFLSINFLFPILFLDFSLSQCFSCWLLSILKNIFSMCFLFSFSYFFCYRKVIGDEREVSSQFQVWILRKILKLWTVCGFFNQENWKKYIWRNDGRKWTRARFRSVKLVQVNKSFLPDNLRLRVSDRRLTSSRFHSAVSPCGDRFPRCLLWRLRVWLPCRQVVGVSVASTWSSRRCSRIGGSVFWREFYKDKNRWDN